jgi:hypothetical protein
MTDLDEQIYWLAFATDAVSAIEVYGPMTFHEARMRHNSLVRLSGQGARVSAPYRAPDRSTAQEHAVDFLQQ